MSFVRSFFFLTLVVLCKYSSAAEAPLQAEKILNNKISQLIMANNAFPPEAEVMQNITILTPGPQIAALCAAPELSIIGNNHRFTGTKSISAQCGNSRRFIQIKIDAKGKWWSAARTIKAGKVVATEDIVMRSGSLEHFPYDGILSRNAIVGQTTTRAINKGQAITQSQLRHSWLAVAGQQVEILAQGNGFEIRSRGKALNNAAANSQLKVSMGNGKIFNGMLSADGLVTINLQE